uniref:Smr domain-containing protein n=1 Tax=Ditylenchus dipsaci TaxID=166011 RepID=A0A915DI24_9BILA
MAYEIQTIIEIILCIFLPPVAIFVHANDLNIHVLISIILCFLFWLPAVTPVLPAHDVTEDNGTESLVQRIARKDAAEKRTLQEAKALQTKAHMAEVIEAKEEQIIAEQNDSSDSFPPNGVQLHLSAEIVNLLNGLFGDGTEGTESAHVEVPLWICEHLYRATQKMEIPEYLPEREVSESDSSELSENGRSSPASSTNQLHPNSTLCNEERVVMLNTLYQMFSASIPMKDIMKCAKQHNFDPEDTYLYLANAVSAFDDIEPEKHTDNTNEKFNNSFVIVPSKDPTVIMPQKKESLKFTRNNHYYDSLENKHTMEQVHELRDQASMLRNKQDHYLNMESLNTKKLLNGHYLGKAREQNKEAEELLLLSDYIELCITKEEHFIDLHTLTGDRALELVKSKIDLCREKYPYQKKLHIITGYGKTTGRPSVLKARIRRFLEQKRIDYHPDDRNQGVLVVKLSNINESLS